MDSDAAKKYNESNGHLYYDLFSLNDESIFSNIFEDIIKSSGEELGFDQQDIKPSFHFRYFSNYLFYDDNGLNVKTIVVEKKYTCLTYLEDYINYYAHCYTKYDKKCKRIHFFAKEMNHEKFQKMLRYGDLAEYSEYWQSYLGCIVIKPLPKGIIGVTYLKTYDGDESRDRHYTAINLQTINLYGTSCSLNTMPYLEQDSNVGSCASAALWMAFQKTSELFHTRKPSPSEITLLAGSDSYNTGKIFPSKGLEISQICRAIYNNGLHTELRYNEEIINRTWIQGFVYAYLRAGIPILFGIDIEEIGSHLITLNGYRFKYDYFEENQIENISYISQFISKFYAHDDQTGPFSRLKFNKADNNEYFLQTSWWKNNIDWAGSSKEIREYFKNEDNYYKCKPVCLIVPLDRKIKVTYEDIIDKIEILRYLLKIYLNIDFVWDVFLIKSNIYKEQIRKQVKDKKNLDKILCTSLPQYIWVAQAYVRDSLKEPIFDFIFDSVEMSYDGKPFLTNIYSSSFKDCIPIFDSEIQTIFSGNVNKTIYKVLVENTEMMYEIFRKEDAENKTENDEEKKNIIKGENKNNVRDGVPITENEDNICKDASITESEIDTFDDILNASDNIPITESESDVLDDILNKTNENTK